MNRAALLLMSLWAAGPALAQVPAAAPPAATVQAVPAPYNQPAIPANRWTPAQIRQSWDLADSDSNGQLTRTEAQHLAIMPRSFEEMDQNKDGVITRDEYEAAFTR